MVLNKSYAVGAEHGKLEVSFTKMVADLRTCHDGEETNEGSEKEAGRKEGGQ